MAPRGSLSPGEIETRDNFRVANALKRIYPIESTVICTFVDTSRSDESFQTLWNTHTHIRGTKDDRRLIRPRTRRDRPPSIDDPLFRFPPSLRLPPRPRIPLSTWLASIFRFVRGANTGDRGNERQRERGRVATRLINIKENEEKKKRWPKSVSSPDYEPKIRNHATNVIYK